MSFFVCFLFKSIDVLLSPAVSKRHIFLFFVLGISRCFWRIWLEQERQNILGVITGPYYLKFLKSFFSLFFLLFKKKYRSHFLCLLHHKQKSCTVCSAIILTKLLIPKTRTGSDKLESCLYVLYMHRKYCSKYCSELTSSIVNLKSFILDQILSQSGSGSNPDPTLKLS